MPALLTNKIISVSNVYHNGAQSWLSKATTINWTLIQKHFEPENVSVDQLWRVNQHRHVVDTTQLKLTHHQQHNPTKSHQMPQRLLIRSCLFGCEPSDQITLTWPITQKVLCLDTRAWGGSKRRSDMKHRKRKKPHAWGQKCLACERPKQK